MRDGWSRVTVGDIAEVVSGGTPKTTEPTYWEGGDILWLTPSEVTAQDGKVITDTERKITPAGLAKSAATMLPVGTVLLTSRATVGAVALAGAPMCTNQGFKSLIADETQVLSKFLMFWVQANREEFVSRASGSTFLEIKKANVQSIPLRLPALEVQRRIVDLIEHIDAVIETAQRYLEAVRALDPALAHTVFEVGDTLPVELRHLTDEGGIQIGPFGSQLHASDYTESAAGVPVVMPRDIIDGRIVTEKIKRTTDAHAERLSHHRLEPGDIVLPRRGDLTKRAVVTAEQSGWLCGTGCIRVRVSEDQDAALVFEALGRAETQRWISDNAVGATMKNLNSKIVGRIPLEIPRDAESVARLFASARQAATAGRVYVNRLSAGRQTVLTGQMMGEREIPAAYDRILIAGEAA